MASRGKKKTTMAKLMRESKMREKKVDKQARKDARKRAAADPNYVPDTAMPDLDGFVDTETETETEDVDAGVRAAD